MVLMRELHHPCKTQDSSVAVSYRLGRAGVLESGFVVRGSLSVDMAQAVTHMPRESSFSLTELASCMCSFLKGAGLGAAEQGARNFGEKRQIPLEKKRNVPLGGEEMVNTAEAELQTCRRAPWPGLAYAWQGWGPDPA